MELSFSKMHALGNDFVVLDGTQGNLRLSKQQMQFLGDRHFGVGCDQILLLEAPQGEKAAFRFRFFNADGAEAEQCGNGMRCLVRFARDQGLINDTSYQVELGENLLQVQDLGDLIRVDMERPEFTPDKIPFIAPQTAPSYEFRLDDDTVHAGVVSMGNPHCVLQVDDVDLAPVDRWGPAVQQDSRFPQGVNVGFMQLVTRNQIRLRVYERGVGETLACGSGACAAVAIGISQGLLDNKVQVVLAAGALSIEWGGEPGDRLYMTGPATHVYRGTITI